MLPYLYGATSITTGTLNISTIANGGVNSSLGATAASTPISISGNGSLAFTGGTASTDRQISTSGTGGTSIQVTSAGTLTLTGAISHSATDITFATNTGNIAVTSVN